ncbi:hypothetical protein [Streptomyces sp. NPDC046925]|uniref:aggregation-promoting factor C-terminal-like domain-containing protein n=1 Tax=Streptomyces sp. NPDC046925 TaxID=3155375 RepID=UPI0033F784AA
MATVTGLNFNVNTTFSGTGINQARRSLADFEEEQRRQARLRATTAAAQARLDQQEAAARQAALRRDLNAQLRIREAAWQRELARRRAALAAQAEEERRHMRQVQEDFKSGWANVGKTVIGAVTSVRNAALGLGPALVPIVTASAGVAGGLVAASAAAGITAGVFGGALFGAIQATNSATKSAQTALEKQKETLAGLTPGTKAYEEQLKKVHEAEKNLKTIIDGLTPAQQKYVKATASMKGAWGDFIKATEKDTLTPVSIVMGALSRNFEKFVPLVKATSPLVKSLAKDFAAWMDGPGLDRFVDTMVSQGVPALENFIRAGKEVIGVLGQGFRDFLPYGNQVVSVLRDGAEKLGKWSAGGGFARFLDKAREAAPDVKEFFVELTKALANIAKAAANLSENSFSALTVLLKVLNSFPPELLANLVRAWLAWNAALLAYNIYAATAATVTAALALATSGIGILFLGMALTIGAVVVALAALGVGIYFLVQNWDTVWNAIKTTAMTVWNFLTNGLGQLVLVLLGPVGGLILLWQNWNTIWGWIASKVTWIYENILTPIGHGFQWLYNFLVGNSVIPDLINGIIYWFNFLLAPLKLAIDFVVATVAMAWTGIQATWNLFWSTFGPVFIAAWTGLAATASAAWNLLVAAWNFLWTTIVSVYQIGWAILSAAWQVGWTALTGAARVTWTILTGAWSVLWATVTGIWNVFYVTFSAVFRGAWTVISAIATGIWNVLRAAWQALWTTVQAIFTTFAAVFTGNWGAAWRAIQAAGVAIWNLMRTAWQAFLNALSAAFSAFAGVFTAAFRAMWTAIQAIATAAWNAFRAAFQAFLTAVQNLWNAAWTAIRSIFQTLTASINAIATAAWNLLRSGLQAFITAVTSIWNTGWTAIRTFFQSVTTALGNAASALWDRLRDIFSAGSTWLRNTFWNPVRDFFSKTIPNAFDSAVKAIGKAWDGLRKLIFTPIQAIVDVVYNGGIRKLWNIVAGVFGADKLDEFKLKGFAKGGPVDGPGSGTSDSIVARLSAGEHVWTAKEVAGAGGHDAVAALRSQAMGGASVRPFGDHAFADGGGILGTGWGPDVGPDLVPDGIIKNALGALKDVVLGGVYGVIKPPINAAVSLAQSTVRKVIPGEPGLEKLATGIPRKMGDTVLDWIKEMDVAPVGGGGFIPWKAWQDGDGEKVTYRGVVVNKRTAAMLRNAEKLAKTTFTAFQGSYSNSVGASAGTHSGGGAIDLGPAKDAIVGAMRSSGFAAWRRTPAEGFSPHIHGIAVGDPTASAAAKAQVKAFHAGKNGLANNGPDTYKGGLVSGGKSPAAAQATAKGMLASYNWTSHWSALKALWNRESGWRWNADNPSSDAYGIPQALPGSKMKSAGSDWKTNPATQIKWGLGYIKDRYGTPSRANSFQKSHNWYALGSPGAPRGPAVVGEDGPEVMNLRGGERIDPLSDLVGRGGGDVSVEVNIPITGRADHGVVDRLERETIPRLTMAIKQGVGRRP